MNQVRQCQVQPPPAQMRYRAWWVHIDGRLIIVGTFGTESEARNAAIQASFENEDVCVRYGTDTFG